MPVIFGFKMCIRDSPGTCHPIYFRNLHVVPRRMYWVELLLGAEINFLDGKGNLDLDEDYMKTVSYTHLDVYKRQCGHSGHPDQVSAYEKGRRGETG